MSTRASDLGVHGPSHMLLGQIFMVLWQSFIKYEHVNGVRSAINNLVTKLWINSYRFLHLAFSDEKEL